MDVTWHCWHSTSLPCDPFDSEKTSVEPSCQGIISCHYGVQHTSNRTTPFMVIILAPVLLSITEVCGKSISVTLWVCMKLWASGEVWPMRNMGWEMRVNWLGRKGKVWRTRGRGKEQGHSWDNEGTEGWQGWQGDRRDSYMTRNARKTVTHPHIHTCKHANLFARRQSSSSAAWWPSRPQMCLCSSSGTKILGGTEYSPASTFCRLSP